MKSKKIYDITLIALMAAVMCVAGPFSIPIGPVPISLTNFVVCLLIFPVGWKRGTLSTLVYLAIGAMGVPVFSGFSGGIGKIAGPTGGYLLGFIFLAVIAGLFIEKSSGKFIFCMIGMILGTAVLYAFGTAWLAYVAGMSFGAALAAGVIPFIIGDLIKIVAACLIGPVLAKRMKQVEPQ